MSEDSIKKKPLRELAVEYWQEQRLGVNEQVTLLKFVQWLELYYGTSLATYEGIKAEQLKKIVRTRASDKGELIG